MITKHFRAFHIILMALVYLFLVIFIPACDNSSVNKQDTTGSASFQIQWPDEVNRDALSVWCGNSNNSEAPDMLVSAAESVTVSDDCSARGVVTIAVAVVDANDNPLVQEEFNCDSGAGTMSVPVGARRRFIISGLGNDGSERYHGVKAGVEILDGANDIGTIQMERNAEFCLDNDGDGYYVENECGTDIDCDDNDANIYPDAIEICGDGVDQDCNGTDEACQTEPEDTDDDGDGYTENQGDCNDSRPDIYPNAIEICDEKDNNCNGSVDEGDVCQTCTDNDNDGYYAENGCGSQVDCNDNDLRVYPGADEICDEKDNNCDGSIDEGDVCQSCTDNDDDGYYAESGCGTQLDCNDNNSSVHPGANEVCNDADDNDCDGQINEDCNQPPSSDLIAYYPFNGDTNDVSGNGNHGTPYNGMTYASGVSGQAASFDGVNDYIEIANKSAFQVQNLTISVWVRLAVVTEEPAASTIFSTAGWNRAYQLLWNETMSGINFYLGDGTWHDVLYECNHIAGQWHHLASTYDGDYMKIFMDGQFVDQTAYSGGIEYDGYPVYIGRNGINLVYLWNGEIDELRVYDSALSSSEIQALYSGYSICTDSDGDGYYTESGCGTEIDCNDNNPDINPGADEICDEKDNDCDGVIDEGDVCQTCTDNDNDGYYAESGCGSSIDCNDNNININPGMPEICADGIDNDCDEYTDCDDLDCLGDSACQNDGFIKFSGNGHYYKIIESEMTWTEAKAYCANMGGYLATITSQAEQYFISTYLSDDYGLWIGGTDENIEGEWEWITGESWNYSNWSSGEPSDSGSGEDYLVKRTKNNYNNQWNDLPNTYTFYFICEKNN